MRKPRVSDDPPVSVAGVENKPAFTTCSDPPAGVENKPASHDVSNKQSVASAVFASTMSGMHFANSSNFTINLKTHSPNCLAMFAEYFTYMISVVGTALAYLVTEMSNFNH